MAGLANLEISKGEETMRKKGFTLVELLVVIAIIALLMGILMPALARVRMIAYRMVCGTNLSGLGKAVLLYAGDAKDEYPMPGLNRLVTINPSGTLNNWAAASIADAYTNDMGSSGVSRGTVGSIFYLLVKYEDVAVKQFNCKGDSGATPFQLSDYPSTTIDDLTKAWDFGTKPGKNCSYSYHTPFARSATDQGFPVNTNSQPNAPLAADRNPMLDDHAYAIYLQNASAIGGAAVDPTAKTPYQRWTDATAGTYKDPDLVYNAFPHQREGQNVLYNDGHVRFEKTANVGINDDNIWQARPTTPSADIKEDIEVGGYFPRPATGTGSSPPAFPGYYLTNNPTSSDDAVLINERQASGQVPS